MNITHHHLLITLIVAGLVMLPQAQGEIKDRGLCSCFGVSSGDDCYGLSYSCRSPPVQPYSAEPDPAQDKEEFLPCDDRSCDDIKIYLEAEEDAIVTRGIDVVLLLDYSKSMEGEKLEEAKKAAISFVDELGEEDRISVIKFDNSSVIVHGFSSDKESVKAGIQAIDIGLRTKYIPPLEKAHRQFLQSGIRYNQWVVIMITDGEPDDTGKPSSIYQKVREMANDEICINTVGYGSSILPGSEAEMILKGMADISLKRTQCGKYYYAPKDVDVFSDVLRQLFRDTSKKTGLRIDSTVKATNITTREKLHVGARIYSSHNIRAVPGSISISGVGYCSPPAEAILHLTDLDSGRKLEYDIAYDAEKAAYSIDIPNLAIGRYSAYISASLKSGIGEVCGLFGNSNSQANGYKALPDIMVREFRAFDSCTTSECFDIGQYLYGKAEKDMRTVLIKDELFVPPTISIRDGTTIIWENVGIKPHTVTSGNHIPDGMFDSGILQPGDMFTYTFVKAGNYTYFDSLSKTQAKTEKMIEKNYSIGDFTLKYNWTIDLVLAIDNSGSMTGRRLEVVKGAAHKLVQMIYYGDRIGLIQFNHEAKILQTFSDKPELLDRKIDNIISGGSTEYVPALDKIEQLYAHNGSQAAGSVVIFLTDGEPWDHGKPDVIYKKVKDLVDKGICIYAVGYGEEITPGGDAEKILMEIVRISQESTRCGRYEYVKSDETKLAKMLGSVYYENLAKQHSIDVEINTPRAEVSENETFEMDAQVRSSFNGNILPGYKDGMCGPPAKVTATFSRFGAESIEKEMEYLGEGTGYHMETTGLEKGVYDIKVKAVPITSMGKECSYEGAGQISMKVKGPGIEIDPLFLLSIILVIILGLITFFAEKKHNKNKYLKESPPPEMYEYREP